MEDILKLVEEHFGIASTPYLGLTYILPNGHILNLQSYTHHSDVEKWLIDNNLSTNNYIKTGGSKTLQELNCIRCDTTKYYVIIPNEYPTDEQLNSLLIWLDFLSHYKRLLEVMTPEGTSVVYKFSEDVISDYIVDRIRRYYISGKLYESKDITQKHQFDFKYDRLAIGEALNSKEVKPILEQLDLEIDETILNNYSQKFIQTNDSEVSKNKYSSILKDLLIKQKSNKLTYESLQDKLIELESKKEEINNKLQDRKYSEQKEELLNKLEPIIGEYNAYYLFLQAYEATKGNTIVPKYATEDVQKISDKWSIKIITDNEPVEIMGKYTIWNKNEPLIQFIDTRTNEIKFNIPYSEFINNRQKSFSKDGISLNDYQKIKDIVENNAK